MNRRNFLTKTLAFFGLAYFVKDSKDAIHPIAKAINDYIDKGENLRYVCVELRRWPSGSRHCIVAYYGCKKLEDGIVYRDGFSSYHYNYIMSDGEINLILSQLKEQPQHISWSVPWDEAKRTKLIA